MDAVDAQLAHRDSALIQFQGYVPGVRENGGQYTHAAVWTAMAFAALGDARRAWELFTMLDPIRHTDSPRAIATYQAEPYVIASDVYALPPHTGRGGWTWYTGSAGWMLRFILESLLGLNVESNSMRIAACLPAHWDSFEVNYRYCKTIYRIKVLRTSVEEEGAHLTVDGAELSGSTIPLTDDGGERAVVVRIHKTGA